MGYRSERAQASVFSLAWIAIAGLCMIGVIHVGTATRDAAMARTAADAAALAGAAAGSDAALDAAQRNEAEIIELHRDGMFVVVVAQVGRATAEARAERVLEVVP